ncbi:MAG TPA: c-type cytochrome biogenesis protein CcmI [Patescibacteria group bacterium]|nr:c-type cytochrome biogenesis protein CcmI [Patescibacteria group bacterium]
MPEPILLALALLAAGAAVLWPVWRGPAPEGTPDDERRSAEMRHRVALESLRDVETDRRAGSLDDAAYAAALAEAEARAAATRAALDRVPVAEEPVPASRGPSVVPLAAAAVIGLALVGGSLLPAAGIANRTEINEGLAAAQAAEAARQHRIEELTEAFAADPQDAAVLSDLADAYLAGSSDADLAAAAAALQLLIAVEPERADAYERIVAAYIRANDFGNARAALDSYEAIASADPVEVAFLDGLIALRGEGDAARAVAAFDRFLELAPDDPRATMISSLRAEAASAP